MSSCCCPEKSDASPHEVRCPQNGSIGKAVDRLTVKGLLTEQAIARLTPGAYRFCPDADCDIVYFSADGAQFGTNDVRVGVWQKQPFGSRQICYCFGESEASIRAEIERSGRSTAIERIREHIKAERCACDIRNPRGTCCLGDVTAAVTRVETAMASVSEGDDAGASASTESHA